MTRSMTRLHIAEADFAQAVVDLAKLRGWMVVHFRPARTKAGWRTPFTGDAGFPDLVLARDGVVLIVELKSLGGRMRPGQREWGVALGGVYRLWRPTDMDEIQATLM